MKKNPISFDLISGFADCMFTRLGKRGITEKWFFVHWWAYRVSISGKEY